MMWTFWWLKAGHFVESNRSCISVLRICLAVCQETFIAKEHGLPIYSMFTWRGMVCWNGYIPFSSECFFHKGDWSLSYSSFFLTLSLFPLKGGNFCALYFFKVVYFIVPVAVSVVVCIWLIWYNFINKMFINNWKKRKSSYGHTKLNYMNL